MAKMTRSETNTDKKKSSGQKQLKSNITKGENPFALHQRHTIRPGTQRKKSSWGMMECYCIQPKENQRD